MADLFARPADFKGQLVTIRALFYGAEEVSEQLSLPPSDRCWSVLAFDTVYHRPLQLFTSVAPSEFSRKALIDAVGVFLFCRQDQAGSGDAAEVIAVPVLVGAIKPAMASTPGPSAVRFLIAILVLTVIYVFVRIYARRSGSRSGSIGARTRRKPHGTSDGTSGRAEL